MLCATVPSCHDDESVYFRQTQASTVSCGIFHKSLSQRTIEYTNYPYKLPNIQNFLLVFIIGFAQLELLLLSSAPLPPTKIEESPTNTLYCVHPPSHQLTSPRLDYRMSTFDIPLRFHACNCVFIQPCFCDGGSKSDGTTTTIP